MQDAESLRDELIGAVEAAGGLDALEELRVSALGRKGRITEMMKGLGALDPDQRREAGQALNRLKDEVANAIDARKATMADAELDARLLSERIDVSLPPRPEGKGSIHPITQTIDELTAIFCEMGFTVAEGPHIESDFYNFSALNIPPEHPARQEQDTFYLPPDESGTPRVLRTHTSPVQ
ncbi:MAG: phenylalanine--tRNA ligase subunit alpha, partial [Alphaproteobacteria bacterium]|nr:phenylalanine--tRNA ligase subunit alpha [Alphaproteobacteria bacterium]